MDDTPNGLLLFAISFGVLLIFVLLLWAINVLPGKVRAYLNMLSEDVQPAAPARSAKPVLDRSAPTSLERQTSTPEVSGLDADDNGDLPDMDAENTTWEAPRVSPYLNDNEFIVFLASQKLRNGKYRLSANDIVKAAHSDRTEVLAIVRQVREAAAEFKPLTPEQAQVREQLQLDQR